MAVLALLLAAVLTPTLSWASEETDPTGRWVGTAETSGERTRVILELQNETSGLTGSLTLVDVGVAGWPESNGTGVEVVFPSDSGDQKMRLTFESSNDGADLLTGNWTETRFAEPAEVRLERVNNNPPINERSVEIDGPAGKLSAAVILPDGPGPHPGVVFLHGAGPQPKDASRFAAHSLARLGIASAIYDKRGVGRSQGAWSDATFEDLADDGVAVAKHLLAYTDVADVGFFGHSQGGWIGPLAAVRGGDAAFVLSSAGPAVPPAREAHWDFVRKLRDRGVAAGEIQSARRAIDLWHTGVRTGKWQPLDTAITSIRSQPWFHPTGIAFFAQRPPEEFARSYRAYMDYDPIPTLRRLTVPLLSILAPEDESIDTEETAQILQALIEEGADIRLKRYPGYDHSLRRLGPANEPLRWPHHPEDYFAVQAEFIRSVVQASAE